MKASHFRELFEGQYVTSLDGTVLKVIQRTNDTEYFVQECLNEYVENPRQFSIKRIDIKDYLRSRVNAPSVEVIVRDFNESESNAQWIRWIWKQASLRELVEFCYFNNIGTNHPHLRMAAINYMLDGSFGVEYLGIHKRKKCKVFALNTGDDYNPTLYCVGDTLMIGCIADIQNTIRGESDV